MKYKVIRTILCVLIGIEILRFIFVFWSSLDYVEILSAFLDHGIAAFICYAVLQFYNQPDE